MGTPSTSTSCRRPRSSLRAQREGRGSRAFGKGEALQEALKGVRHSASRIAQPTSPVPLALSSPALALARVARALVSLLGVLGLVSLYTYNSVGSHFVTPQYMLRG